MFVSIKLIKQNPDFENKAQRYTFLLEDTDFVSKLELEIDNIAYDNIIDASVIPSGLISIYKRKEKNIPKNLAMFYLASMYDTPRREQERLIEIDFGWTDTYMPELNCMQYKRCLLNQMYILGYSGKIKYAQRFA